MPDQFGLMTKQEAKQVSDLMLLPGYSTIVMIAEIIAYSQRNEPQVKEYRHNKVVTDDVESFFKNDKQYTTDYVKQGYPAGQGLLRSISWA